MKKTLMLALALMFAVACSHSQRDPASVKKDQDTSHERFQGTFDRPNY